MSRTLKYLLTTILIIAAAMWVLTVYRSCQRNKAKKENTETTAGTSDEANSGTADNSNTGDIDDLYVEEDDEGEGESDESASNVAGGDDAPESEEDTEEKDDDIEESDPRPTSGVIGSGGEYLVVAGAFIAKSNAEKLQKQLKRKGYDSEIRVFLGSDYHSVIAGDYSTEAAAQAFARKIGGEAYVHKRRHPKKR